MFGGNDTHVSLCSSLYTVPLYEVNPFITIIFSLGPYAALERLYVDWLYFYQLFIVNFAKSSLMSSTQYGNSTFQNAHI